MRGKAFCAVLLWGIYSAVNLDARPPAALPASLQSVQPSTSAIRIVHPPENARLRAIPATFVYGSVPAQGRLRVNGQKVPVHTEGGFIAMLDLSPGKFSVVAELETASGTYKAVRNVFVDTPPAASPVTPLTIEYVTPERNMEVLPGDEVLITCKGSPGMDAYFAVGKSGKKRPMAESSTEPGGIYKGVYIADEKDKLKKAGIKVTLFDKKRGKKKSLMSTGSVSLFRSDVPLVVEVSGDNAVLRSGPSVSHDDKAGYMIFPPSGTRLRVTGRVGNEMRVSLSRNRDAWISENEVRFLAPGMPPGRSMAGSVLVEGGCRSAFVRVQLDCRVPFEVKPFEEQGYIDISLFGVTSNTDWINYISTGPIEQVSWHQDDTDTYRLRILTGRTKWWGYDARYEGSTFVFELRSPPAISRGKTPLKGITVALDPGHSPDTGAIGPTGLIERDANLAIALVLKEKLSLLGASVVMTRTGNEPVDLYGRTRIAWRSKADMLISIHNNALPDGGNPFKKNGYGVYYFHPMSFGLASRIYDAYGEMFGAGGLSSAKLRNDGLYYGNLALVRMPQMPSVLVESAYMIVPQEEAYLKSEKFRSECTQAITRGIQRYIESLR